MTVTIIKKPIIGKVEKIDKKGMVEDTEEFVVGEMVVSDDKPMATVGVEVGTTKNLGDYNSLRVDVSLFMPSETDNKSLNKTFKRCFKWCDNKLDEIVS